MYCTKCLKKSSFLITTYDMENHRKDYICQECFIAQTPGNSDLEDLEDRIEETEDLSKKYAHLVNNYQQPDTSRFPESAQAFIMTPAKLRNLTDNILANMKKERAAILKKMSEVERLGYDLKKAVKSEDYEAAARLRDMISAFNGKQDDDDTAG